MTLVAMVKNRQKLNFYDPGDKPPVVFVDVFATLQGC